MVDRAIVGEEFPISEENNEVNGNDYPEAE